MSEVSRLMLREPLSEDFYIQHSNLDHRTTSECTEIDTL